MTHTLLVAVHALAAALLGVAIAGLWLAEGRARRAPDLAGFAHVRRRMALLERRLLLPSVLALLTTGTWLVAQYYGLHGVLHLPWLAGMVAVFVFQSAWANAVTRSHAARLDRLTAEARPTGALTPALRGARAATVPTFGRHVEPLAYLLAMSLGAFRPMTWAPVVAGMAVAVLAAAVPAARAAKPSAYAGPPSSLSNASVEAEGRS